MTNLPESYVRGRVQACHVVDGCWYPNSRIVSNNVLYSWSELVSRLLTTGDARYRISGMYLEFQNDPGGPISPPPFDRTRTIAYYGSLAESADRDFLRVPLTASLVSSTSENRSDDLLTFFATSTGVTGIHGKPFSATAQSVVFGASLVAMPQAGDRTQDVIFSSLYLPADEQQPKLSTGQVGLRWELTLG